MKTLESDTFKNTLGYRLSKIRFELGLNTTDSQPSSIIFFDLGEVKNYKVTVFGWLNLLLKTKILQIVIFLEYKIFKAIIRL